MKNITLTIIFAVMLTGCGLLPDKFDSVEFGYLAELKATSVISDSCDQKDIDQIQFLSLVLVEYSKNTLNKNTANIYSEINQLANELVNNQDPSEIYCKLKRNNISRAADSVLETFGKKRK